MKIIRASVDISYHYFFPIQRKRPNTVKTGKRRIYLLQLLFINYTLLHIQLMFAVPCTKVTILSSSLIIIYDFNGTF